MNTYRPNAASLHKSLKPRFTLEDLSLLVRIAMVLSAIGTAVYFIATY